MSYAVMILLLTALSLTIILVALLVGMSLAFVVLDRVAAKMVPVDEAPRDFGPAGASQIATATTAAAAVTTPTPVMQTAQ